MLKEIANMKYIGNVTIASGHILILDPCWIDDRWVDDPDLWTHQKFIFPDGKEGVVKPKNIHNVKSKMVYNNPPKSDFSFKGICVKTMKDRFGEIKTTDNPHSYFPNQTAVASETYPLGGIFPVYVELTEKENIGKCVTRIMIDFSQSLDKK